MGTAEVDRRVGRWPGQGAGMSWEMGNGRTQGLNTCVESLARCDFF